jgi:hypothetical protein
MRTNAPHLVTWVIAVVIGVLGIVTKFVDIPALPVSSFGLVMIGFIVLALGSVVRGM